MVNWFQQRQLSNSMVEQPYSKVEMELDVYMKKINLNLTLHHTEKFYLKCTINLNVKMFKLLEENIGENHHDLWVGKSSLEKTQKSLTVREQN